MNEYRSLTLKEGWCEFYFDSDLHFDDTCLFELIDLNPMDAVFKVSILSSILN